MSTEDISIQALASQKNTLQNLADESQFETKYKKAMKKKKKNKNKDKN